MDAREGRLGRRKRLRHRGEGEFDPVLSHVVRLRLLWVMPEHRHDELGRLAGRVRFCHGGDAVEGCDGGGRHRHIERVDGTSCVSGRRQGVAQRRRRAHRRAVDVVAEAFGADDGPNGGAHIHGGSERCTNAHEGSDDEHRVRDRLGHLGIFGPRRGALCCFLRERAGERDAPAGGADFTQPAAPLEQRVNGGVRVGESAVWARRRGERGPRNAGRRGCTFVAFAAELHSAHHERVQGLRVSDGAARAAEPRAQGRNRVRRHDARQRHLPRRARCMLLRREGRGAAGVDVRLPVELLVERHQQRLRQGTCQGHAGFLKELPFLTVPNHDGDDEAENRVDGAADEGAEGPPRRGDEHGLHRVD
mmetsp:Transcript_11522/g.35794  ORF Transcript_11522/g.35794 Transcript_11522/m.35794 type:complete len:362 (+) Transcript_11522:228-1313(+)